MKNSHDYDNQRNMSRALIYFCGKNEELMPAPSAFFLTEFYCALSEFLTGKEVFHSFRDWVCYEDWGRFLSKEMSSLLKLAEKQKTLSDQIIQDLRGMTHLEWDSDEWGDGEYTCAFLRAFDEVRNNCGWTSSVFKLWPKEKAKLEKVITTISAEFNDFCPKIVPVMRKYIDNDIDPGNQQLKGNYW